MNARRATPSTVNVIGSASATAGIRIRTASTSIIRIMVSGGSARAWCQALRGAALLPRGCLNRRRRPEHLCQRHPPALFVAGRPTDTDRANQQVLDDDRVAALHEVEVERRTSEVRLGRAPAVVDHARRR